MCVCMNKRVGVSVCVCVCVCERVGGRTCVGVNGFGCRCKSGVNGCERAGVRVWL